MRHLKNFRVKHQFTQAQLAALAGLSQGYINELENGRKCNPSISVVIKLAHALDIPVMELLSEDLRIKSRALDHIRLEKM